MRHEQFAFASIPRRSGTHTEGLARFPSASDLFYIKSSKQCLRLPVAKFPVAEEVVPTEGEILEASEVITHVPFLVFSRWPLAERISDPSKPSIPEQGPASAYFNKSGNRRSGVHFLTTIVGPMQSSWQ
ncbi:hypothetical protein RP20_CCG021663 [Aedes albopictus]|nr:hypothetical protein RP20_CCG021663 [Aedes albopictus]